MLAIVAAMDAEVQGFRRRGRWERDDSLGLPGWRVVVGGECSVHMVVSGVGRQAAEEAARRIVAQKRPEAVLSVGFCGGLAPDLRRGDLIVAARVRAWPARLGAEGAQASDERLIAIAESCPAPRRLRVVRGDWLTIDSAVSTVEEKRRLARESGAVAVEMESYWLAEVAAKAGVPFLGVRAVLDDARSEVPSVVTGWNGSASAVTLAGRLLRKPAALPRLIGLARSMVQARRNLTTFVEAFVEEYARRPEMRRAAAR